MKWYDKMMKKIIGNVKMKAALNFETSSKDIFHWYQLWLTGKETNEVSVLINFMFFCSFIRIMCTVNQFYLLLQMTVKVDVIIQ